MTDSTAEYARLVPFLPVTDVASALGFYEEVFGLSRTNLNTQDGRIVHAELRDGERVVLMLAPEGIHSPASRAPATGGGVSPAEIQIRVDDAGRAWEAALARGARGERPPRDVPWGERHAHIIDPDGHRWLLSQVLR